MKYSSFHRTLSSVCSGAPIFANRCWSAWTSSLAPPIEAQQTERLRPETTLHEPELAIRSEALEAEEQHARLLVLDRLDIYGADDIHFIGRADLIEKRGSSRVRDAAVLRPSRNAAGMKTRILPRERLRQIPILPANREHHLGVDRRAAIRKALLQQVDGVHDPLFATERDQRGRIGLDIFRPRLRPMDDLLPQLGGSGPFGAALRELRRLREDRRVVGKAVHRHVEDLRCILEPLQSPGAGDDGAMAGGIVRPAAAHRLPFGERLFDPAVHRRLHRRRELRLERALAAARDGGDEPFGRPFDHAAEIGDSHHAPALASMPASRAFGLARRFERSRSADSRRRRGHIPDATAERTDQFDIRTITPLAIYKNIFAQVQANRRNRNRQSALRSAIRSRRIR